MFSSGHRICHPIKERLSILFMEAENKNEVINLEDTLFGHCQIAKKIQLTFFLNILQHRDVIMSLTNVSQFS